MVDTLRSSDGRVVVDARLRKRRVDVRRDAGRRRLQRLGAVGVILAVLLVAYGISRSPLLAVHTVRITGATNVSVAQVRKVTGITEGVAMTDVSPGDATRALEGLPWVSESRVRRDWPRDVHITIVERIPVAQVDTGKSWLIVDEAGSVLEARPGPVSILPTIAGLKAVDPGHTIAHASLLVPVVTRLPDTLRDEVADVRLATAGNAELRLHSGAVVLIGGTDKLPAKFSAAATVLADVPAMGDGCTLDVVVPESPVVTPAAGCVPEGETP